MQLLISGLVSIIIMEAYAWLPRFSHRLLDQAVRRLRKRDQERCREEWIVGLEALPNTFAKLFHAIRFVRAARRIGDDSFRSELRMLDEEIAAELRKLRSILADEEWGEVEAIRGSHPVCKAVGCRPEWCRHSPPLAAWQPAMSTHDHLESASEAADWH